MDKKYKFQINETLLASLIASIIFLGIIIFLKVNYSSLTFKCPNDYSTEEEYINGLAEWTAEELLKNPEATFDELYEIRAKVFAEHNCELGHWDVDEILGNGSYLPIPSTDADENYGKDFKTYESELGFSFKYPPHLITELLPRFSTETTDRIILRPKEDKGDVTSAIIISIAENDENLSPKEWLLGPTSGFKHSDKYHRTTIDGQDAVYTEGGMWTVVNTPDNKYRLSIADLSIGDAQILFTEMGIVVESLIFKR